MKFKAVFLLGALLMGAWLCISDASAEPRVLEILQEADTWITQDTSRILSYIDSCNQVADQALRNSKHWQSTYDDLSFLLGIDLATNPQVDNTGRIYFMMRITGQNQALFYLDSPMEFPHQLTPNNWADQGISIGYYTVHPSGKYVLALVHQYGDENFDVYKFDRDGKFQPLLVAPAIQFRSLIFKNEDEFFLMSNDHKTQTLIKYTISTAKIDTVYTEPGWYGPDDYQEGKLILTRWMSFSESQLFILDEATGKTKDITKVGLYYGGLFTSDGDVLTYTDALSTEEEFAKVALIDLKKPKKLKLVFDPKLELDAYSWIAKLQIAVGAVNRDGYSELMAFDLKGKRIEVPQPEIGVITNVAANDYGDVVFDFSSPRVAPTFFHFRLGWESMEQMVPVSTFGFDFSKMEVQVIRYPSKDGTMIPALLYAPKDAKKDGNNPAVVSYHGGPPSQSRPYFQRNIAFALSRGLVMLFPNVRGSSGYGPAWEQADNLEGRFSALEDDVAAIDYLINEKWSNPDKIAIWGASYGGYTVNYLAANYPNKFACVVSEVGVADVDYSTTHGDVTFSAGWEKEMGPVGSELTQKLSPIFNAHNVARPILVTAGFHDPRVFPGDPRRFGYVLKELGKDVLYLEQTKSGHGGAQKTILIEDFTRSYVFMLEHLLK
ncbi:MAG: S9 family peptidase [Candidatus Zixiibacteriota bacterium]|nr:MAG: S9 family peptidase [candidate division Zixibacteria bacterium]